MDLKLLYSLFADDAETFKVHVLNKRKVALSLDQKFVSIGFDGIVEVDQRFAVPTTEFLVHSSSNGEVMFMPAFGKWVKVIPRNCYVLSWHD